MKKYIITLFLIILTTIPVFTNGEVIIIDLETATYEEINDAIERMTERRNELITEKSENKKASTATKDQILFRNIPWHSNVLTVRKVLGEGIDYSFPLLGSNGRNHGGDEKGFIKQYNNLDVAGYSADRTLLCYIYPVKNNQIITGATNAQFYLAVYQIEVSDVESAVADLKRKLIQVYGTDYVQEKSEFITWTDQNGNGVRIRKLTNRVDLLYYASDIDDLLSANAFVVKNEASKQEELQRNKNQNNTEGL